MHTLSLSLSLSLSPSTVEVAVIDEAQMIRDAERGGAWTRAILGKRIYKLIIIY